MAFINNENILLHNEKTFNNFESNGYNILQCVIRVFEGRIDTEMEWNRDKMGK